MSENNTPKVNEQKEKIFKNASPKLTFIFGLVFGIAVISLIGFIIVLILSSQKPNLTGEVSQAVGEKNTETDQASPSQANLNVPKKETAEMNFFVMAFCPYGQQAEAGIIPLARLMGDKAKITPHYVIYDKSYCQQLVSGGRYTSMDECQKSTCLAKDNNTWYCSMHGINELNEDVRQLCLWKYDQKKWWDYVEGVNSSCQVGNIETCWKEVANKLGINTNKIESCLKNEANSLLSNEVSLNEKYGVGGSPQIFINDTEYQNGARTPEAFKQVLCSGFKNPPAECSKQLSNEGAAASGGCQ